MLVHYVEDNPGDAELVQGWLASAGEITLHTSARLAEGLTRIESAPPDAVLLDLNLPDASGLEGLEAVRRQAPRLPVVVLTGQDDTALGLRAVRLGAQDFLVKGAFAGGALARVLRFAVERKQAEHTLSEMPPGRRSEGLRLAADTLLERLPLGVLFLDRSRRVVGRNPTAAALLATEEALRVDEGGRLGASRREDAAALAAALERVATESGEEVLLVPRPYRARPLELLVLPVASGPGAGDTDPVVTVLVHDPERLPVADPALLRRVFDLTPMESRLASMVGQGISPKAAAATLGVSWNTVRFHLRSLFAKTGTSRQAELVRLLSSGLFPLRLRAGGIAPGDLEPT